MQNILLKNGSFTIEENILVIRAKFVVCNSSVFLGNTIDLKKNQIAFGYKQKSTNYKLRFFYMVVHLHQPIGTDKNIARISA